MIQLIEQKAIDRSKWNRCIYQAYNSRIYAYSWYLDMVAPNWCALVLHDYEAVMPIYIQKKWGISYCFQPIFTQQLGVFTAKLQTPQLLQAFINKLSSVCQLTDIHLNQNNLLPNPHPLIRNRLNHEMDLILPYKQLYKQYSKNNKRNIKKAEKNHLSALKTQRVEAVIDLFKHNKGKEVKQWGNATYKILSRLIYRALHLKQVEIWCAYTEDNNLCAGAFFLQDNRRHTFLFSGSNTLAKENGAMSFLIDQYIQRHSQQAIILDFEGSDNPNLARFYKGFGAQAIHYPQLFFNHMPWYAKWMWEMKKSFD